MKKLPLSGKYGKGRFTMVDDEDAARIEEMGLNLRLSNQGYVVFGSKKMGLHRIIVNAPKGKVVDHINHNKLDNRKENLRVCSNAENLRNQKSTTGSSKFKGVSFVKISGKWKAELMLNRKSIYIGVFKNEIDAALAYNKKAKELFGEFAFLNDVGLAE